MTSDEAEKKIRAAAAAGRVEAAPQDVIEAFGDLPYDVVKHAVDVDQCWISDQSSLSDFLSFGLDKEASDKELFEAYEKVCERWGVEVTHPTHPFIIDICRAIHAKTPTQ